MAAREFKIHGMDCADEIAILRRALAPLVSGEDRLAFDLLNAKMTVIAEPGVADAAVLEAVRRTGMRAEPWRVAERGAIEPLTLQQRLRTVLTTASGALLLGGFVVHAGLGAGLMGALGSDSLGVVHEVPLASRWLYGLAALCGSWFIVPRAWSAVRRRRPDMNLLMTLAVLGAIGIGEWLEAATVAFLFAVSLALETWSVGRARRAVERLLDLAPPLARLLHEGRAEEVPPGDVAVGSRLLIRPGERVPLDGIVRSGVSHVNQAPITGESVPVEKAPGAVVFAGTINGDGALEIESTKVAAETTLAHIIRMVGEAQRRRGPAEQWVERFARIYTPSVLALAAFVAVVPPILLSEPFADWFYRSLVLLVIGCPCALVISTPVTVVAGLAAAARLGVLVKGGAYLEAPARLAAIALDKTGTLTQGEPRVTTAIPLSQHSEEELIAIAAGMESHSDHPLARAIVAYAAERRVEPAPVAEFQLLQGKGATAALGGRRYWIGSHRYLEERGQETPEVHARVEQLSGGGQTIVILGDDEHVCGVIALADSIRPEAPKTIAELRASGIRHIVVLTGDNAPTAHAIAALTGVDEVRAELLPADKVAAVEELVAKYGTVAMVGDGINDAPAMARATLGIAMGAAGSDAAIETADVALMTDDLSKLPWLIRHSRRAMRIIRTNITLSLATKALFVGLTVFGHASLWAAIGADMGVSLLVIANALRLLRGPPMVDPGRPPA